MKSCIATTMNAYGVIEHEKANELINTYGSPLYIFNKDAFIDKYKQLLNTFRGIYNKYNIAYSFKTNYTPEICKTVKQLGGLAEVVSDMEYRHAKKLGYKSKDIIFNGPVKGEALFEHLLEEGIANIDNLDEMKSVVSFAKQYPGKNFKIAYRVNIDVGQGYISRFGLDAYEDASMYSELNIAHEMLESVSNISLVGLHCHIGRSRNIEAWAKRTRIMFKLVDRLFVEPPKFIDFGSGMNSIMEPMLAEQFSGQIPTFDEYAKVVATAMQNKYGHLPYEEQPILYTEPGTTVVSGSMSFIATIKSIKTVKGKTYVTFDCSGGNIGDICHLKQLPITVYNNSSESIVCEKANFVGYTCLEHDHIYQGYTGDIAVGDFVQFRNVGSYSNVFKPPFIAPNCAMIQIDKEGTTKIIKRKETIDDIFNTYVF